jgi:hypothetical protein
MLLCQHNPLEESFEKAANCTNHVTGPTELQKLIEHFEDFSLTEPKNRTLLDWWRVACDEKLKYHPWIDQYIAAAGLYAPEQADTQPKAMTVEAVPMVMNNPLPVTTGDIAHAFDGLRGWSEEQWKKPLGDKPAWLVDCVVIPGVRGKSETRWNPVSIGAALVRNGHAKANNVRGRFQSKPQLKPWLDAWKTYEADNLDTV